MKLYKTAFFVLGLCWVVLSAVGCSSNNSPSKYNPAQSAARKAIETGLSEWKSGKPVQTIDGKPAINVFDARWSGGAKLESFEIGEPISGTEHPQFKVKIKLQGADEETNEYLVVGIDPLLVFRDEDYRRTSGL